MLGKKCDLCEKKSVLNNTIQCKVCGKNICSNHSKEQFIRYPIYEDGSFIDFLFGAGADYNYPNGDSFNKNDFICYGCRTGKIPDNSRDIGFSLEELIIRDKNMNVISYAPLFLVICVILAIGIFILGNISSVIYRNDTVCNILIIIFGILILFSIILFIISVNKSKKWLNEQLKKD